METINLHLADKYPYMEELANALTHGIGVVFFLILAPLIIAFAVQTKDTRKIVGACIFCFGLLSVYISSAIFHAIPDKVTKEVLNYFDYLSIYFLISGSYTAFLLIYFRNIFGNILISIIWTISLFGISFKVFFNEASFVYSLIIFLGLGWIGVILIKPALREVKSLILYLVLIGGMFYTAGTYFFYYDTIAYYHAIWHVFVLFGSLTHWVAILLGIKDKEIS